MIRLWKYGLLLILPCFSACSMAQKDECSLPNGGVFNANVVLNGACHYDEGIRVVASNVTVDCAGATIDGGGRKKVGVLITGVGINDVTVSNCHIRNFSVAGVMVVGSSKAKEGLSRADLYARAPKRIRLQNLIVEDSLKTGVNFNAYVTDSELKNSRVVGSKGVGIYLSQSTSGIHIVGNAVVNNGFSPKASGRREGLAIDSSAKNLVAENKFQGNAAGGVFLYKNCGEKYSSGHSVLRWQHSNNNVIEKNWFYEAGVGVWVASRQSKDLSKWDCGDPAVDSERRYYEDFADHNVIRGNKFCESGVGVRVEGNNTEVSDNVFSPAVMTRVDEPYRHDPKPDGKMTTGNTESNSEVKNCRASFQ